MKTETTIWIADDNGTEHIATPEELALMSDVKTLLNGFAVRPGAIVRDDYENELDDLLESLREDVETQRYIQRLLSKS